MTPCVFLLPGGKCLLQPRFSPAPEKHNHAWKPLTCLEGPPSFSLEGISGSALTVGRLRSMVFLRRQSERAVSASVFISRARTEQGQSLVRATECWNSAASVVKTNASSLFSRWNTCLHGGVVATLAPGPDDNGQTHRTLRMVLFGAVPWPEPSGWAMPTSGVKTSCSHKHNMALLYDGPAGP